VIRRAVFLDRASLKATVRKPAGAAAYVEYDKTSPDEIVPRLAGADVAIVNKVTLRAPTLEQLPDLKMIAVAATGYDVIDVPYCKEHGIAVATARTSRMGFGTSRTSFASSRIPSATCTARRSESSARAPSVREPRQSAAPSA